MKLEIADTTQVEYYMHRELIFVPKSASIQDAIEIFKYSKISHLPVLDDDKLVGMISKEDLLRILLRLSEKTSGKRFSKVYLHAEKVTKIMSAELICLQKTDHRDYAVELLLQNKFHSLPVVGEGKKLLGLVTALDLLKGYYEILFRLSSI